MNFDPKKMRNVAIIAHVDHGKTTMVDELLKMSELHVKMEEGEERLMDNDDIEKERGITILSKNCAIDFKEHRINIVDTPGHADFGGQVERVLGTVDGVLLIVDAWEGPMAQTRFVTKKALAMGLKPIVVINKIDRDGCRPDEAVDAVFDLFIDLDATEEQLEFPIVYASGRSGFCRVDKDSENIDMGYLLDKIIEYVPQHIGQEGEEPLLQITTLEHSEFLGSLAIGRIIRGSIKQGQTINQATIDGKNQRVRMQKVLHYDGATLTPCEEAFNGEIVALAGFKDFDIGDTISGIDNPEAMERMKIDPPTISMAFTVNDSPLVGQFGGKFLTGNHLLARLEKAKLVDPALRVERSEKRAGAYIVSGRGVMHLTVLIENMRRELYEFSVGAPEVLYTTDENGNKLEPIERLKVEVPSDYSGAVIEILGVRKGNMLSMEPKGESMLLEYTIPARGLIGLRTLLLSATRGYAIMQTIFEGYEPFAGDIVRRSAGAIISKDKGSAVGYALWKLADRGEFFVVPGDETYPGMIIGEGNRHDDIVVNCIKGKQLTNMRSSGADDSTALPPARVMSLEEAVTWINDDEMVEVTPEAIRMRKLHLDENARKAAAKA